MEVEYVENELKLKIFFVILGIGSLSSLNAILTEIPYFIGVFPKHDISFYFILFNCSMGVVFQFYLVARGNLFTYKSQVITTLLISSIIVICLPLTSYYLEISQGFIISSILIFIQGFANAVIISGMYAMASFLPSKYMVFFTLGQSFSGILMNIVGFIVYGIIGGSFLKEKLFEGALIYFIVTAIIILINVLTVILIYKERFFIYSLRKSGEFSKEFLQVNNLLDNEKEIELQKESKSSEIIPSKLEDFLTIIKAIPDLALGMIFINFSSFLVFPGAWREAVLVSNGTLNTLILLVIFNTCDAIGRYISEYFSISRKKTVILTFLRTIPLILIIFIGRGGENHIYAFFENKAVIVIVYVIFAFTNGYCTVLHFIYGPGAVENRLKGKAGSLLSLAMIIGIFIGSMVASFGISKIIK